MIILVTGATSGFGKATAEIFAKNGYDVIITGRRQDRLDALAKELNTNFKVNVLSLCFDIRKLAAVEAAIKSLSEKWQNIDVLVNNAGLAVGMSTVQEGTIDDWERMIDTNVKGLLYITRHIAPMMIKNGKGHIINIGSTAGKEVYPNGNVYCASKHAVDALNKGMRIDLLPHGIKVTAINPGLAETEFGEVRFKGDKEKAALAYKGLKALEAVDVAETVWWVANRPAHVNILDVVLTPTAQANTRDIFRK